MCICPIYSSIATAQAATIAPEVRSIQTQFRNPTYSDPTTLVGDGTYSRMSKAFIDSVGYPAAAYFRSTDRFMPDGTTDVVNGGYWMLTPEREINLAALGAMPSDVTMYADNNADVLQAACELAMLLNKPVLVNNIFQIGVRSTGTNTSFISLSLKTGESLQIVGVDPASSILKEKAGKTKSVGRFNKMFYITVAGAENAEAVSFKNLTIDKNGINSLPISSPARLASTTNLVFSGEQIIDGVAAVSGDRVLAAGQSAAAENGVYVVAAGAWTRATDLDSSAEILGSYVAVSEGTEHGGDFFRCTNTSTITVGTTAIAYSKTASSFFYEQSHSILIEVAAGASLKSLYIDGCHFRDKTSGHIVISGTGANGPVIKGLIEDSIFDGWIGASYLVGQRGDVECQGAGTIDVVDCKGSYLQTEPNGGGFSLAKPLALRVRGGEWANVDLDGIVTDQNFIFFDLIGTRIAAGLNVDNATLTMTDCDFVYSETNDWINVKGKIKGGACRMPVSGGALAQSIQPRTSSTGVWDLEFIDVEFTLNDSSSGNVTGFLVDGAQPNGLVAARAIRTTLSNCKYDPRFEHIGDAYRETGTIIVRGGAPKCTGYGFRVGGTATPHYGFLELYDVDFRGIGGTKVMISGPSSNWGLRMTGEYPIGEISFGLENSATVAHVDAVTDVIFPKLIGDAVPSSGAFFRSMRLRKRSPAAAASPGWVCTTSHGSNGGTWSAEGQLS